MFKFVLGFFFAVIIFANSSSAQTRTKPVSATKIYVDKKAGFSVEYGADFVLATRKKAATEGYFGDPGKGRKLMKATIKNVPEKYHGFYEFNVWVSTDRNVSCAEITADDVPPGDAEIDRPETVKVGGHTFYTYDSAESGMSKSVVIDGLRARIGNKCWQIQSVTSQVSAYDDYKEFDDKIIRKSFDKFVKSFKLLGRK